MKISKVGLENAYKINQLNQKTQEKKQTQVQMEKKIKEEIELSAKEEIKRYKEVIKNMPDIREERVRELKDAIERGNYKINVKEVSNRLIEDLIIWVK